MAKTDIEKTTFFKEMEDGAHIAVHKWYPKSLLKKLPRFVVCISHGMAEHALRYTDFAQFLCDNQCVVYVHDHRGHGKTAITQDELGYICETNGFERVVLDLQEVINSAKNEYPGVKIVLLGHSFGSFVSQRFIQLFGEEVDACILSGTAGPNSALTIAGEMLAKIVKNLRGAKHPSPFLDKVTFGSYNSKITNPTSPKAWISRDEDSVKSYIEDPLCGFICTAGFFADLTHGLNTIFKKKNIRRVRKDLPIFLFAGTGDPVGNYTKTIQKLANLYKKYDVQNVQEKYYDGGRHEMLSEINRQEVYSDILNWMENN